MSSTEYFDNDTVTARKDRYYYEGGKLMASPHLGDEIVISGDLFLTYF